LTALQQASIDHLCVSSAAIVRPLSERRTGPAERLAKTPVARRAALSRPSPKRCHGHLAVALTALDVKYQRRVRDVILADAPRYWRQPDDREANATMKIRDEFSGSRFGRSLGDEHAHGHAASETAPPALASRESFGSIGDTRKRSAGPVHPNSAKF